MPPAFAHDLRQAGFTVMNNANNHSYDFGPAGLAEHGRARSTPPASPRPACPTRSPTSVRAACEIAILGFAPYSDTASLLDLPAARALIERGRHAWPTSSSSSMHAGAEGTGRARDRAARRSYVGEDRGNPEAFAHMAVDAGADLVLGSRAARAAGDGDLPPPPDRLQPRATSPGYHNFGLDGVLAESAILHVRLAADGAFLSGRVESVRLVGGGQPELDPAGAGAQLIARLSRDDLGARAVAISARAGRITLAGWPRRPARFWRTIPPAGDSRARRLWL